MNPAENVSFIRAQLTIARWYLDRAARADRETSILYVHHAQQAWDIVMQLVPDLSLEGDFGSLNNEIAALRLRLGLAQADEAAGR
jgi:hypothetical protein